MIRINYTFLVFINVNNIKMGAYTKNNLNSEKFEQNQGDVLNMSGNTVVHGQLNISSTGLFILYSPNGTKFKITVNDNGELVTSQQ